MAIIVTEDPQKLKLSLRAPWRASREFIVTGTDDPTAAIAAVDGTSGVSVPQVNDPWVSGSSLLCIGPEIIERQGIDYWRIGCEYIVPTGGSVPQDDTNPILRKPRVSWSQLRKTEVVDTDLDGRPIKDTAGNSFGNATRDAVGYSFLITRIEPYFDILKSHTYSMAVNSIDVTIDRVVFRKWRLLLESIVPVGDYELGAPYVTMGYQFHYMPGDALGDHPWQGRYLNEGPQGWYDKGGKANRGSWMNDDGDIVFTARLNLDGTPLLQTDEHLKVQRQPAIANPVPQTLTWDVGAGAVAASEAITSGATTIGYNLYYKRVKVMDLSPILFG